VVFSLLLKVGRERRLVNSIIITVENYLTAINLSPLATIY
jgi:hypothetical protein